MSKLIDFGGDLLAEISGEIVGVKMLKSIISKAIAHKATASGIAKAAAAGITGGKTGTSTEPTQTTEAQTPEIRFGGMFDLSDEIAFGALISKMNANKSLVGAVVKVSIFLNDKNRFTPRQREKFRAVVGSLGRVEYTKQTKKTRTKAPQAGSAPGVEDKTTETKETKSNLGIDFMKGFAVCSEDEMMEVCRAMGIHDSIIENVSDGIIHLGRRIARAAKTIEQSSVAQTIMTSLADKMRARINAIKNKP